MAFSKRHRTAGAAPQASQQNISDEEDTGECDCVEPPPLGLPVTLQRPPSSAPRFAASVLQAESRRAQGAEDTAELWRDVLGVHWPVTSASCDQERCRAQWDARVASHMAVVRGRESKAREHRLSTTVPPPGADILPKEQVELDHHLSKPLAAVHMLADWLAEQVQSDGTPHDLLLIADKLRALLNEQHVAEQVKTINALITEAVASRHDLEMEYDAALRQHSDASAHKRKQAKRRPRPTNKLGSTSANTGAEGGPQAELDQSQQAATLRLRTAVRTVQVGSWLCILRLMRFYFHVPKSIFWKCLFCFPTRAFLSFERPKSPSGL